MSMREQETFIRFENIHKAFGANVVFKGLSLAIRRGETISIVGASGAGKSVLLKMLIGLIKPDSGTVYFDGIEVAHLSERDLLSVRKRISMLFQGGALFDSLNVAENIAYPLREHHRMSEKAVVQRVQRTLELVGLPGIGALMPATLSGGMKKRVALARAIASEPDVVLYDEPTTGLDPVNVRRITELIVSIQRSLRVTSIVITHDLTSAYHVSDRMALLADRRIVASLPRLEFLRSEDERIREFVQALMPRPGELEPIGNRQP